MHQYLSSGNPKKGPGVNSGERKIDSMANQTKNMCKKIQLFSPQQKKLEDGFNTTNQKNSDARSQ